MHIEKLSNLVLEKLDNRLWRVHEPFSIRITDDAYVNRVVIVPAGFVTNGVSSPRIFWSVCPPLAGPFGEAAVVHDYMYSCEGGKYPRVYADEVLVAFGYQNGASFVECGMVYLAVRLFGSSRFKKGDL
jgi:hypothetical protein